MGSLDQHEHALPHWTGLQAFRFADGLIALATAIVVLFWFVPIEYIAYGILVAIILSVATVLGYMAIGSTIYRGSKAAGYAPPLWTVCIEEQHNSKTVKYPQKWFDEIFAWTMKIWIGSPRNKT